MLLRRLHVVFLLLALVWTGGLTAVAQVPLTAYRVGTLAGSDPLKDGQPAAAALLDYPADVALAADGSLLIADQENWVIRRVAPDGVISTAAGARRTDRCLKARPPPTGSARSLWPPHRPER